jgi:hypothetical protein
MMTGIFSIGLAVISGVLTTMASSLPLAIDHEVAVRTLLGLTVFILVAIPPLV